MPGTSDKCRRTSEAVSTAVGTASEIFIGLNVRVREAAEHVDRADAFEGCLALG